MYKLTQLKNFIKNNNLTQFSVEDNVLNYNNKSYVLSNTDMISYDLNLKFLNENLNYFLEIDEDIDFMIVFGFIEY